MFKKLVSNLPFSPQLIGKIGFYARRLGEENATRRLAIVFAVLTVGVQMLTVISPPEPSVAASNNDIIYGGIADGRGNESPKETMLRYYDANQNAHPNRQIAKTNLKAVFNYFNITRQDIKNSRTGSVNSRDAGFLSLGRNPTPHDVKSITVNGSRYYLRPLKRMVTTQGPEPALVGQRSSVEGSNQDKFFAILYSCGNIVIKTTPSPKLEISKTKVTNHDTVKPGDQVTFRTFVNNHGTAEAKHVRVVDPVPNHTTHISHSDKFTGRLQSANNSSRRSFERTHRVQWRHSVFSPTANNNHYDLSVKVNQNAPDGAKICNRSYVYQRGQTAKKSAKICYRVKKPTPQTEPEPEPQPQPTPDIDITKTASQNSVQVGDQFTYQITVKNTGDTTLSSLTTTDTFPNGIIQTSSDQPGKFTASLNQLSSGNSKQYTVNVEATQSLPEGQTDNQACVKAEETEEVCDTATITHSKPNVTGGQPQITQSKLASNLTQGLNDAQSKRAQAGDKIEYRLTVNNTGDATAEAAELEADHIFEENIRDILEYAELIDASPVGDTDKQPEIEGGIIKWPAVDIPADSSVTMTFRIKVKSPIPKTPGSTSDPASFDLKMTNVFGNSVEIKLPAPVNKTVENTVKELPNTGIGLNAALIIGFTSLLVYFYMRNKQLIDEIHLLRNEYNQEGVQL